MNDDFDHLIIESIGRYHEEYPDLFERYVREQTDLSAEDAEVAEA